MTDTTTPTGCSFLIEAVGSTPIFTPEQFSEEQRMFGTTADEFMRREVMPLVEELEHPTNFDKMVELLRKAAEIGLLMIDIPEEYGGLEVDKTTSMIVTENLSAYAGFSVTYGAHTGIGMLPLLYFGTHEQKAKWLPKIATGELIAAYALTEPGSGSDAMAAKTKAIPTDDGHYILNGSKMWITNAGFADLFTVFCQIDGSKFSAFIVEGDREGVSTGVEEKKMGIKGSSTRQVMLDNVKVPASNLLGEIGKGHKIAFNILNIGRFKLGVGVLGGAKRNMAVSIAYAKERKQFGQPIADFGAIRAKIAEMSSQLYTLESMCYRVAGYMDQTLSLLDNTASDYTAQAMSAIEEFAVEDSILKVYGSEVFQFVADEGVQIHGGYGFSSEYSVERDFRDCRINRIFEGTNEINRMLIPGTILKRTMKGQLNLFEMIARVEAELAQTGTLTQPNQGDDPKLEFERFLTAQAKRITVYVSNQAIQKHMADLREQQEILMALADLMINLYAMDSVTARTMQVVAERGLKGTEVHRAATRLSVAQAYQQLVAIAEELLCHLHREEKLTTHLENLDRLAPRPRVDTFSLRRQVADVTVERGKYPF